MDGIWKHLKHFKPTEAWGDPARMSGILLITIDIIRDIWGPNTEFVVNCGFASDGHTPGSCHYKGDALDHYVNDGEPYPMQVAHMESALRDLQIADRVGLGIYPDWRNPGFHLDVRGTRARWGYVNALGGYIAYEMAKEYAVRKFSYPGDATPGKP